MKIKPLIIGILVIILGIGGVLYAKLQSQSTNRDAKKTGHRIRFMDVRRQGTSRHTLKTPSDFPKAYVYGSGRASMVGYETMEQKLPKPKGNQTILNTRINNHKFQALYLWEKNKMPSRTKFTKDMTGYFDAYHFRPYVTILPVKRHVKVKGAVVLLAGGAFEFRGNYGDTLSTAAHLRELGFQTFIVDDRLNPYSQEEGALDAARAVRFIRKHAKTYQIKKDQIAVMGYSAGGIQAGEFLLNYDGKVTGKSLDPSYQQDALDHVNAKASAAGMIYSFYGRLSVASLDRKNLKRGHLPPTFYIYGTEDPFYDQFNAQYKLMKG